VNNNNKSVISQQAQQLSTKNPCTIYKIKLDFLNQSNLKTSDKFIFNQLCENSTRTIQRDTSNFSSQFIFNDDEMPKQYSVYQRIINASNVNILLLSSLIIFFVNFLEKNLELNLIFFSNRISFNL